MTTKNAFGRIANRRSKMLAMAERSDESDVRTRYLELADQIEERLRKASVCIRCGRVLEDSDNKIAGYGAKCLTALQSEDAQL